jgi:hypothetical protein
MELGSFSFLTDRHVLLAVVYNPDDEERPRSQQLEPALLVVDFISTQNDPTDITDVDFECALDFPTMLPWARALAISVRSDPSPSWTPHPDLKVPFHTARHDRLFVITLWVVERDEMSTLLLFVPSSTVLSKLNTLSSNESGKRFEWEEWGPDGSHLRLSHRGHSMVWVCYIFGISFIAPYKPSTSVDPLPGFTMIQILDFNQVAIKRLLAEGTRTEGDVTTIVTKPSRVTLNKIFTRRIETRLPYRLRIKHVPGQFNSAMLSEDAIVTVSHVGSFNYHSKKFLYSSHEFPPARRRAEVPRLVFLTRVDVIEVGILVFACNDEPHQAVAAFIGSHLGTHITSRAALRPDGGLA